MGAFSTGTATYSKRYIVRNCHFGVAQGTEASFKFELIDKHHNIKGHVEIGYLTKFGALKLNRDQVMTLETWLKIHPNVCNFVTASPPKPYNY